jgi:hypothetical protein
MMARERGEGKRLSVCMYECVCVCVCVCVCERERERERGIPIFLRDKY